MSQLLTPIDNGVQQIQTTTTENRLLVLSQQYISANHLENRPTQWVPGGRPIYRRLPAASETYQIDFFNVVTSPNTAAPYEIQEQGYVYIPWGEGLNGGVSMQVVASNSNQDLLIKSGTIVWRYGNTQVLPTIVNLEVLDVVSGKYDVAYQLVFDDSPLQKLYQVSDYALTGLPLSITSSSDSTVGWRYPAVNAFLNTSDNWWANQDTFLPSYAQPTASFIRWESDLPQAYSQITLRCPPNTAYTGTATLSYYGNSTLSRESTVSIQEDSVGQFFQFVPTAPVFQSGWNVSFSSLDISVQSVTVSGVLTLLEPQASPSTRATLVMYPVGTLPKTVVNASNKTVPATYCQLAQVDITKDFKVEKIQDVRYIIHRDYVPVADWLTNPFDEDLINLYEQVTDYGPLWMAPPSAMNQEYAALSENQITVEA